MIYTILYTALIYAVHNMLMYHVASMPKKKWNACWTKTSSPMPKLSWFESLAVTAETRVEGMFQNRGHAAMLGVKASRTSASTTEDMSDATWPQATTCFPRILAPSQDQSVHFQCSLQYMSQNRREKRRAKSNMSAEIATSLDACKRTGSRGCGIGKFKNSCTFITFWVAKPGNFLKPVNHVQPHRDHSKGWLRTLFGTYYFCIKVVVRFGDCGVGIWEEKCL